jgi:hypothetical protein
MRCFTHREVEAIGICAKCGRAVCPECAIVEPQGLFCSAAHAEESAKVNALNSRAVARASRSGLVNVALEALVGFALLGFMWFPLFRGASPILLIMGVLMLLYAVVHLFNVLVFRRDNSP